MFKVAIYKKTKQKKNKKKTIHTGICKKMGVVFCHEEAQKDLKNLYELPKMLF